MPIGPPADPPRAASEAARADRHDLRGTVRPGPGSDVVSRSVIHRGALIRMVVIAAVAAVITTLVAVLIRWLPTSASEQMDRITFVYWFATIICIAIFSLVAAVIVEAVWAFRVQPDDDTDGPPIHGNTKLEIAWTVVPAILVISIGVVSAVVLSRNANAGPDPLQVKVFAQQFAWKFEYPGNVKSEELVMPLHRSVKFEMQSADVIHSFWIPQMGQKQDVVPGITTEIVVTPTRTGSFTLICTELCGLGHATMRAPVRVLPQAAFTSWLAEERAAGASGGSGSGGGQTGGSAGGGSSGGSAGSGSSSVALGKTTFASAGCGGCHAFGPAGTDAQVGPSLDNLAADAKTAGEPEAAYIKQSITDPNAVVVAGYQPGVMPTTFAQTLSPEELDGLVAFLSGKEGQ
jgi:cytochrome c oxidase subunit 2